MERTHQIGSAFSFFGAILLGLLLSSCEILDPNPGPAPYSGGDTPVDTTAQTPRIDTVPPSIDRGKDLFLQNCARCHGFDASGTIYSRGSIQGKKGIHLVVRQGRGGMPSFTELSDNEIESIELWLGTFDPGLEGAGGEDLFLFYCAGCHGPEALGTSTFNGSIQGYSPIAPIVHQGIGEMPAIDITDDQIDSIQAFLELFSIDFSTLSGRDYFARLCASCHGSEGEGTDRGPEIRNPVRGYSEWVVRNGRSGNSMFSREMPKYSTDSLSQSQLDEIISWLRTAPKPYEGKLLYNRFCSTCHGFDGRGGPTGENITGKDRDEFFEKVREGEGGNNYSRRNDYMPRWSSSELTDAEIGRIADWIRR